MTTTDSVDKRGHLYPNGSRRFVHAAIVAGFMATFMFSDNVFGDEPQSNPIADVYYDAGVKARIDKDLARALELFRKAWALEHSALIAAKLAQTERDLGHYRDAIEHFEFFMQQAGQSEEDRGRHCAIACRSQKQNRRAGNTRGYGRSGDTRGSLRRGRRPVTVAAGNSD
jgi:tetratricopeptide (TPR) repeat protein